MGILIIFGGFFFVFVGSCRYKLVLLLYLISVEFIINTAVNLISVHLCGGFWLKSIKPDRLCEERDILFCQKEGTCVKIKRIEGDNSNQIQSAGKSLSQHNEQQTVRQLKD